MWPVRRVPGPDTTGTDDPEEGRCLEGEVVKKECTVRLPMKIRGLV